MQAPAQANTWDRVLDKMRSKISHHSFSTWLKPTRFVAEDASSISIRVPNTWFAEWLKTNYYGLIQDALRELQRPGLTVEFVPEPTRIEMVAALFPLTAK